MNTLKRIFHLLCDPRSVGWYTRRWANAWIQWHPRIHFGFDFDVYLNLGHKADLDAGEDEDMSWGPEFGLTFGVPWFDFALTIPNDCYKDD